jgi:hypothetical protein
MENTEKQQLALIADMIAIARKEFSDNSFIYLLWGWAVSICSVAQFVLIKMNSDYNGIVWLLMVPTAIVQIVYAVRSARKEKVRSHMDRVIGYVWVSVLTCLGITLTLAIPTDAFPFIILLYGIGTFIAGSIMDLNVMRIGAICCWVIGAVAFHTAFEYQLLLLPLSLMASNIIPGYALKRRFKNNV